MNADEEIHPGDLTSMPRHMNAAPSYEISLARKRDLARLPSIELAALRLFDGQGLDDVPALVTSEAEFEKAQENGHLWVALADDAPVGFAHVKVIENGALHLEELDVHPEHGRRGLGRRLVMTLCHWAAVQRYEAVSLTTFRDLPWNMPFYASLGFTVVSPDELTPALAGIVHEESSRGLDPALRVVMRRACEAPLSRADRTGLLTDSTIRQARESDHAVLLALWERAVRATHHFLTDADVEYFRPLVAVELRGDTMDLWILANANDVPLGFIGMADNQIEALFLEPVAHRRGGGRLLVTHAQALRGGALTVDVNEQNGPARAFYARLGFGVVGRSDLDTAGRPFPLLHLRRPPPTEVHARRDVI